MYRSPLALAPWLPGLALWHSGSLALWLSGLLRAAGAMLPAVAPFVPLPVANGPLLQAQLDALDFPLRRALRCGVLLDLLIGAWALLPLPDENWGELVRVSIKGPMPARAVDDSTPDDRDVAVRVFRALRAFLATSPDVHVVRTDRRRPGGESALYCGCGSFDMVLEWHCRGPLDARTALREASYVAVDVKLWKEPTFVQFVRWLRRAARVLRAARALAPGGHPALRLVEGVLFLVNPGLDPDDDEHPVLPFWEVALSCESLLAWLGSGEPRAHAGELPPLLWVEGEVPGPVQAWLGAVPRHSHVAWGHVVRAAATARGGHGDDEQWVTLSQAADALEVAQKGVRKRLLAYHKPQDERDVIDSKPAAKRTAGMWGTQQACRLRHLVPLFEEYHHDGHFALPPP